MKDRNGQVLSVGDRVWFTAYGEWFIGHVRVLRPSIFHNVEEALVETGGTESFVRASWVAPGDIQRLPEGVEP